MITMYAISHFYITQGKLNGPEASQTFSIKEVLKMTNPY
jgi:hypothetical protein